MKISPPFDMLKAFGAQPEAGSFKLWAAIGM
jgi:hypothetical protein